MIVAIVGSRGVGKDTVGKILVEKHGFTRIAFADKVKEIAMDLYGLALAQVHGTIEQKETVDPRWGLTPRFILQRLGTDVARNVHPETWIRYVMRQIASRPDHNYVITDCRFPNEADAVRKVGGVVWRVRRSSAPRDDGHASEVDQAAIVPDWTLENEGTIDELAYYVDWTLNNITNTAPRT